ncbi:ABC transporter substrate-binding protein [Pseudonocardia oroxyli]|uniref:ABC-type branched-chain amino acid transport system, substrate-binding protein n=1 Tax=Pseudonocardia oroxyli TaxID=366584 RepID=A0A1G8D1P7_PSEOR|nr:ABC transporter substrate-binding protein [Pseudonocardia oroxyli]SDH51685.1 ABC-type branched-chain amino acid transport system, substrate-binding protein [Pseudonocardia oroxyli]
MVIQRAVGAALLCAVLAMSGCASSGTSDSSGDADDFVLYASMALTGPIAGPVGAQAAGLKAGVSAVNKDGGIDGRQIRLVLNDDGGDPGRATTLLQEQLDKGPIDLAIPGSISNVALAAVPILTREKILSTGFHAALQDAAKYPYEFNFSPPMPTQTQGLVDEIVARGFKKVALLHANDATGNLVADSYERQLAGAGLSLTTEGYALADVDMTAQLQALQAKNPDVFIFQGFGPLAGYILKDRTKLGWDIPTYGNTEVGSIDLTAVSSPADWKNFQVLAMYSGSAAVPRTAGYTQMTDALKEAGVTINQALPQYAAFWDIPHFVKRVWESADSKNPDALVKAWLQLDEKATPDSPFVFMSRLRFSPESHSIDISPEEAVRILTPGPLVDGQMQGRP